MFDNTVNYMFTEAIHCPVKSEVRALITRPPPRCQSETILRLFDESFVSEAPACSCCYQCMRRHSLDGCKDCASFFEKFFPINPNPKVSKSVIADLKDAIEELFAALRINTILVENELKVTTKSFIIDFVKMVDEVKSDKDIVDIWHIDAKIAHQLFQVLTEVVLDDTDIVVVSDDNVEASDSDSDVLDISTDTE